jgi:hypothetical protein
MVRDSGRVYKRTSPDVQLRLGQLARPKLFEQFDRTGVNRKLENDHLRRGLRLTPGQASTGSAAPRGERSASGVGHGGAHPPCSWQPAVSPSYATF